MGANGAYSAKTVKDCVNEVRDFWRQNHGVIVFVADGEGSRKFTKLCADTDVVTIFDKFSVGSNDYPGNSLLQPQVNWDSLYELVSEFSLLAISAFDEAVSKGYSSVSEYAAAVHKGPSRYVLIIHDLNSWGKEFNEETKCLLDQLTEDQERLGIRVYFTE